MFKTAALSLILVLITGFAARAQQPPPPNRPSPETPAMKPVMIFELGDGLSQSRHTYSHLLKNQAVLQELDLSEEQKAKLKEAVRKEAEILTAYGKAQRERIDAASGKNQVDGAVVSPRASVQELNRLKSDMHQGTDKLFEESNARIAREVLNRRQVTRLKEIRIQAEGPGFFLRPEAQEVLALEPDQIDEIKRIITANRVAMKSVNLIPANLVKPEPGAEPTPQSKAYAEAVETTRGKVAKVRISTMKAIEQVLTKPQRGKYKSMVGEPFPFFKPKETK
jgi:Spy/CpxP family protein refolding chaperone